MTSERDKSTFLTCGVSQLRLFSCAFTIFCLLFSLSMYLNNTGVVLVHQVHQMLTLNQTSSNHLIAATRRPRESCNPATRLVYIKTHKTAGTTLATILQRYGYTRNLTFAIPAQNTPVFQCCRYFKRTDVFRYENYKSSGTDGTVVNVNGSYVNNTFKSGTFNMMTSHAVYLRPEMDAVVPGALFVTSVRDPVEQFESAFVYFDMAKQAGISAKNPLASFFTNPQAYKKKITYGGPQVQNGQLFDLGLSSKQFSDEFYVRYKIRQIDNEFDLVVVKEHFDESLILMKKLFCWDMDDILYIPKRVANLRFNMSHNLRQKIRKWNHADVLLYEHFNRTLWRKIGEYGPDFERELAVFRQRIKEVSSMCEADAQVKSDSTHHLNILKSRNNSEFCQNLYRLDGTYVQLIRERMKSIKMPAPRNERKVQTGTPVKKTIKPNSSSRSRTSKSNIRKAVKSSGFGRRRINPGSKFKKPVASKPATKTVQKVRDNFALAILGGH